MRFCTLIIALTLLPVFAATIQAEDWMFSTSYYSHNEETGERVTQHTPIGPFYIAPRPDYVQSGYRHRQSILQVGNRSDRLHIIEQWGKPVRPYGEWQYPYRPYSVPYRDWGVPFGGLGNSYQGYGFREAPGLYNAPSPRGYPRQPNYFQDQQHFPGNENNRPPDSTRQSL